MRDGRFARHVFFVAPACPAHFYRGSMKVAGGNAGKINLP
jgi:hypothetical protein